MDNKEDEKIVDNNESASLKDYEIEVDAPKGGFFSRIMDKLKGKEETKALGDGTKDTFQRTNRSIASMWTVAGIRRAVMEKLDKLNKSLFRTPEVVDQSNITTHIIGRDEIKKDDLSQENEKTTVDRIIPIAKSAVAKSNRIIPQPVKTGIINNAKSTKDVKEEIAQTQGIKVEDVEINEGFIGEYEKDNQNISDLTAGDIINSTSKNINQSSSIEVGKINVGGKTPKEAERNDNDERDI